MSRFNRKTALYAVTLVTGLGGPALAADVTAKVGYRAYELQAPGGPQAVFQRIQRSAKRACLAESPMTRRDCRKDLSGQLAAKIGHPTVLALAGAPVEMAERGK